VVDTALPVAGGRIATGRWAEYAFGAQFPGGLVAPNVDFPAATIRSVDIGLCSAAQAWTSPNGCGTADQMMRQLETLNTSRGLTLGWLPGLGACFDSEVGLTGRPGTQRWSVELGTPNGTPIGTQDLFCVEFGLNVSTQATCFSAAGFPSPLGCVYDAWTVRACGEFGTRLVDGVHRDPTFTLRSFESVPGPGHSNGAAVCTFPVDLSVAGGFIESEIRKTLVDGINASLRSATTRREFEAGEDVTPHTCSAPFGITLRSRCATPDNGWTPDQDCADFLTGDPNSTAVRSTCEARRSGVACASDVDCNPSAGRRCDIVGHCLTDGFGSGPCVQDTDCQSGQCVITHAECVDSEAVCYWNVEVDRVETLPSGLQVVIAEDAADETFPVVSHDPYVFSQLIEDGICRPSALSPFGGVSASGTLGPASGAPIP
jgi:hypothetical protein